MAGPYPGYGNPAPANEGYSNNVARQHNCAAKSLLYGGDAQDNAPHREGKKSVPHGRGVGAPFATYDDGAPPAAAAHSNAYNKQVKRDQQGAGKVGAQPFDPEVYRNNRENNAANVSALKSKNWGSGQVMHKDKGGQGQGQEGPAAAPYVAQPGPCAQDGPEGRW